MRTVRERALLALGYDAMTRREELVAVDCEDLTSSSDGSARLLICRSKTDPEGEGSVMYLAPQTARYVRTWLKVSGIHTGAIFRRIIGGSRITERLGADSVNDVLKRVAASIGLEGVGGRVRQNNKTSGGMRAIIVPHGVPFMGADMIENLNSASSLGGTAMTERRRSNWNASFELRHRFGVRSIGV